MHGDGFLRANAGLATAVLGGPTFPITECNKGNKLQVCKMGLSLQNVPYFTIARHICEC